MMERRIIGAGGGKGGGGGSAPSESPNTLQSSSIARIIDLISEGEIIGLYTGEGSDGKEFPFKAIYVDNIPIQADTGGYIDGGLSEPELSHWSNLTELNYEGIEFWERVGLPDQDPIPEFSEVESEITINQEVTDASPVLFVVSDNDVDSIRLKMRLPALYEQNSSGSLVGSSLNWIVEVKESGGAYFEVQDKTITGKNTSPYEYSKEFIFSEFAGAPLTFPLTFRVTRVTPDSDKASLQQDLFVNSYTEVQKVKLRYSDSAIVAIRVDSELFSGRVPSRSFLVRGLTISVPTNYFPETRRYNRNVTTGAEEATDQAWDGLFYTAWSDNPAWVLYDILTNPRYGLGEFIDAATQVDIYSLYDIAVYCDEKVDNGLGNGLLEPRYTFNGVIATREDAFDVVNAITSTFRGMSYWSAGGVTAVSDSPKDPKRLVTRANVIKGHFTYSGTALRAQHSAALISYNTPDDNYKQTIEVVEDPSRREQFGWREIEVAAFGTTSRGQAYRLGRWILDSEKNESEILTFTSGVELSDLRPGDIIQVADPARQQVRRGGRILSHAVGSPDTIEVDAVLETYDGDTLLVTNELGGIESLEVEAGYSSTITLKSGVTPTETLMVNAIFIHRGANLVPEEWRVLSMRETEELTWEFSCLTYDSSKFARIEGLRATVTAANFVESGPDTIVRTDGGSFVTDGFEDGQKITVGDATLDANNGIFTVDSVTASTLTLSADAALSADTGEYINIGTPSVILDVEPTSFLPTGPLLPATNLSIVESIYKAGTAVQVLLDINWTRSTDPRARVYRVESRFRKTLSDPVDTWDLLTVTAGVRAQIQNAEDGYWSFRVIAQINESTATQSSALLEVTDQLVVGKTAPPPNVTNLTAVRGFVEVVLDWDDVDDLDLAGYVVKRGPSWDDGEVLANPVFASTYTATAKSADNQRYHVRAVDTLGNVSVGVTSITTSIQALAAVSDLYAYQVGDSVRVTWTATQITENVHYEIRFIDTTAASPTLGKADVFADIASAEHTGLLPVNATTTYRFYVRPYVTLATGSRSYGTETSVDLVVYPILNGFRVLSRTEETGWSSLVAGAAAGFVEHARTPDFTMADGTTADVTYDTAATPEISNVSEPTFHCNMTVTSAGTAEGAILLAGRPTVYGILACFNASGDLVVRAGTTDPVLRQLADTSNMLHQWNMFEVSGSRLDDFGSNDLTVNGSVGSILLGDDTPTMAACADFSAGSGAYLSGTAPSIAGSDWTLSFRYKMDPYEDYSGQVFSMGGDPGDFTISVRFFESTQEMQIEVTEGASQEILIVPALDGSLAVTSRVVIWYVESTKTLSCELRNGDRDDVYGLVTASKVLAASITDEAGPLHIGNSPLYIAETFYGQLGHFVFLDRAVTSDERWDLHHYVAPVASPRVEVAAASIPKDTPFDLVIKLNKGDASTACSLDVYVNGTLTSQTDPVGHRMPAVQDNLSYSPASVFVDKYGPGTEWMRVGTDKVHYNVTDTATFDGETGNFDTALSAEVTLNSDLNYWKDEPVVAPLEIVSDSLTLTQGAVDGTYDFPFVLPTTKIGRLWYESTSNTISADELLISEALAPIGSYDSTFIEAQFDVDPLVTFWIDIEDTGTFIPFVPGTYQFETATVRAILQRGANELTRPAIDNLSVYFTENPTDGTLQASTTDATQTTMTYDGGAVSAVNIPTIPDDFSARITGRLIGRNQANGDVLEVDFVARLTRGTGAASTTLTYSLTVLERDAADWVLVLEADTTYGGLAVKVTGEAGLDIEWLCDVDVRDVG
jgi:predicted phage tail protein